MDLSGRIARVGSADISSLGFGSIHRSSSHIGVSRELNTTLNEEASSMEVSRIGQDHSNGHTSVFTSGFGSLLRNVSPYKPSVGKRELSTSAAQAKLLLFLRLRKED